MYSITLQITDDFVKVIMHCNIISCVICMSNIVDYLKKGKSLTYSTKEVIL